MKTVLQRTRDSAGRTGHAFEDLVVRIYERAEELLYRCHWRGAVLLYTRKEVSVYPCFGLRDGAWPAGILYCHFVSLYDCGVLVVSSHSYWSPEYDLPNS
jgi:hypothetical protein